MQLLPSIASRMLLLANYFQLSVARIFKTVFPVAAHHYDTLFAEQQCA